MTQPWEKASYPRVLLFLLLIVVGVAVVIGGISSTTAFGAYNPTWDGVSELRTVSDGQDANSQLLRNVTTYPTESANDTVSFVLSPETAYADTEAAAVTQFVRTGGTLVIAEDFGSHSNPLLAQVGSDTRVNGTLLRDEQHYGASPALPVATRPQSHPLTANVTQLTLNRGTAITSANATVLMESSNFSYLDVNSNSALDESEVLQSHPVATIESVGTGEVVVVGDPSLFINVMMDNDGNRAFARNLIDGHETVLFDVSHQSGVPPLISAQLTLQQSPVLQGGIGVAVVVVLIYRRQVVTVINQIKSRLSQRAPPEGPPDQAVAEQLVADQFPEWDEERVRQVTKEVISEQQQEQRDD